MIGSWALSVQILACRIELQAAPQLKSNLRDKISGAMLGYLSIPKTDTPPLSDDFI